MPEISDKFYDHFTTISHRAAHSMCQNREVGHLEDYLESHEFIHGDHHEEILKAFKEVSLKNPQMRDYVKDQIVSICLSVLSQDHLEDHHEHAQNLHDKIHGLHEEISQVFSEEHNILGVDYLNDDDYEAGYIRDAILRKLIKDNHTVVDSLRANETRDVLIMGEDLYEAVNDNRSEVQKFEQRASSSVGSGLAFDEADSNILKEGQLQQVERLLDEHCSRRVAS